MPITDLTGYTWVGNTTLNITENGLYDINGSFDFGGGGRTGEFINLGYAIHFDPDTFEQIKTLGASNNNLYANGWLGANPVSITFTGGTDATNSTLISWLESNGTLTAPEPTPSSNMSIGNLSISKMSVGSLNVESVWLGNEKIYGGEPTPSGYNITVSGVFETSGSSNISSAIKIDGTTCSVNAYGTPTNIPHTFNNIVVESSLEGAIVIQNSLENVDRGMNGVFKIISGTGGVYDYRNTLVQAFSANDILEYTYLQDTLYLVPTSDLVIQLGYYED